MNFRFTPLNPLFADLPMSKLIMQLEANFVFKSEELEDELSARLERDGKRWRFAHGGKIKIFPVSNSKEEKSRS